MAVAIALTLSPALWGANTKRTVTQVSSEVMITTDLDYHVSNATPFTDDGVVNIVNTDHAVLILDAVKPSAATALLKAHVKINGATAVNNTNCQVKLYNRGCIILPYGNSVKPLTVYSEQNFGGESANSFDLGNDGGFMNTLTDDQLNNRIRSFKLKRGYMVTFSIKAKGRGYSRCFIADEADLEFSTLPAILDRSISSYRIFKWYDTGKAALANSTNASAVSALNVTSCYSFGLGESRLPDAECVPHHIYENWPSAAECGKVTYSPHLKTNNEPRNTADPNPNTLEQILANWEDLMATGMRLCTPSSWDGSDYTNGSGFLKTFCDEIDSRGWRCDIVDLHCYWPESNFGTITNWKNTTGRPVWISEWVWGASWNSNGAFASGVTEAQNASAVSRICNTLNNMACVERYYYWNSERDPSKIYKDGSLTAAGKNYANINSGVGYKKSQEYVPKAPPQTAPANLAIVYDKKQGKAALSWEEGNGEMNDYIYVQRRKSSSDSWSNVIAVPFSEETGVWTVEDVTAEEGWEFRICEKNAKGVVQYTNTVMVVNSDIEPGDAVTIDNGTKYIGGNVLVNGSFDMGTYGWTNGTGTALAQPWFQTPAIGGSDGGPYLQCYGNGAVSTASALKTAVKVDANADYYFLGDAYGLGSGSIAQVLLSTDGTTMGSRVAALDNTSSTWVSKYATFNTGDNNYVVFTFRSLAAKAMFDNLRLCRLFDSKEEALADGAAKERLRAQAFMQYDPQFNNTLNGQLAVVKSNSQEDVDYVTQIVSDAIEASVAKQQLVALTALVKSIGADYTEIDHALTDLVDDIEPLLNASPSPQWVLEKYAALKQAYDQCLDSRITRDVVKSPTFTSTIGWNTKTGTHTDGDQRTATQDGVTCWNAWWALNPTEDDGRTMAINQVVSNLSHGLYFVECDASTQHFCLSDQHAYITSGEVTAVSPTLTADYLDLPNIEVSDRWQTLTSAPVYVDKGGSVTIGFISSKEGSTDLAYHKFGDTSDNGDHREGWWCATNFKLGYIPYYRKAVNAGEWQVGCLPYRVKPSANVQMYSIVGINSTLDALCLEPISEASAGMPFIYKSSTTTAEFRELGDSVTSAMASGPGNLRGFFVTTASSRAPVGTFALVDGAWTKVAGTRPNISSYSAYMRKLTETQSTVFEIKDGWAGETMPIVGLTDEEKALIVTTSISAIEGNANANATMYNTNGVRVGDGSMHNGVYIKVENGKAKKTIVK